jgi:hypothetical protein
MDAIADFLGDVALLEPLRIESVPIAPGGMGR